MPGGVANFLSVVKYPTIKELVKDHGENQMLKAIFLLIKDFCDSVNVVRNMNEDQMIETASMLLEECENFRLEDYAIMFSMAKRGKLYKIFDHIDIIVITEIMDNYYEIRRKAGSSEQSGEIMRLDSLGSQTRLKDSNTQSDDISDRMMGLSDAFANLKDIIKPQI